MSKENTSTMDKFIGFMDKASGPMIKFGQIPFVKAVTNGMVNTVGITMIGSLFLVIYLLGSDGGLTQTALLPFLKPYANDLVLVNSLSMGIMAIYMAVAMGSEYAEVKGIHKTTGSIGSLFAFILLNYNTIAKTVEGSNALEIGYWGGAGVITAMLAAAISINVIHLCYKYNIKIKLPDSVPPAIAESFSAIIPYFLIALVCWGIRTIGGINIPQVIEQSLIPVLGAADNIFVYTLSYMIVSVLWIMGLHGDNIVGAVITPFTNVWTVANNEAFLANQPIPHIWTGNLNRLHMWVSSCWPLLVYMFMSSKKLPHLRSLGLISLPPAVFCIIEPIMFGLPVVLNPFLAIPFVLSHTITGALTYFLTSIGFVGKLYISLPWATPSPILGFVGGGGSIGGLLVVFINFAIGMAIFYPFWKAYEKSEIKRIEEEQNQELLDAQTA